MGCCRWKTGRVSFVTSDGVAGVMTGVISLGVAGASGGTMRVEFNDSASAVNRTVQLGNSTMELDLTAASSDDGYFLVKGEGSLWISQACVWKQTL